MDSRKAIWQALTSATRTFWSRSRRHARPRDRRDDGSSRARFRSNCAGATGAARPRAHREATAPQPLRTPVARR